MFFFLKKIIQFLLIAEERKDEIAEVGHWRYQRISSKHS